MAESDDPRELLGILHGPKESIRCPQCEKYTLHRHVRVVYRDPAEPVHSVPSERLTCPACGHKFRRELRVVQHRPAVSHEWNPGLKVMYAQLEAGLQVFKEKRVKDLRARATAEKIRARASERHGERDPRGVLDGEKIKRWMKEEGYENKSLATELKCTARVVTSLRNNGAAHGPDVIRRLANLMNVLFTDLYRDD